MKKKDIVRDILVNEGGCKVSLTGVKQIIRKYKYVGNWKKLEELLYKIEEYDINIKQSTDEETFYLYMRNKQCIGIIEARFREYDIPSFESYKKDKSRNFGVSSLEKLNEWDKCESIYELVNLIDDVKKYETMIDIWIKYLNEMKEEEEKDREEEINKEIDNLKDGKNECKTLVFQIDNKIKVMKEKEQEYELAYAEEIKEKREIEELKRKIFGLSVRESVEKLSLDQLRRINSIMEE